MRTAPLLTTLATLAATAQAWLPASGKIRGVNLGSLFVFEPWMSSSEWSKMGCSGQQSEFDCVMNTGQTAADSNFQAHWKRWVNETDLDEMMSLGLNTVRIPLGYWLKESLVDSSEHFPKASCLDTCALRRRLANMHSGGLRLSDQVLWLG